MENSVSKNEIESIAHEITNYLDRHPFAADTIEGICHWWITQQRIEEEHKKVLAALDYLLEKALISMQHLPNGAILYSALNIYRCRNVNKN